MSRIGFIAASVILALIVASSTLFIVDQRQIGVVYTLGEGTAYRFSVYHVMEVDGMKGLEALFPVTVEAL